ncbi:hypothetical protein KIPB_010767 [Kipferlia bialata]|uniref:CoA-binding domain-containing protein n=1 Tax=Kipferlia bialata TaxID=797122 RepID=A0A9K3D5L1_9EUKA|nr:hypothetical protein KIPB_010767 [Kipferlia bialata]|eukprot:g10767.t1
MRVVVLGASDKPSRTSYEAVEMLMEYKHEISGPVDTVTVYLNKDRSWPLREAIKALQPRRVIFNPGSESEDLSAFLQEAGIEVTDFCTLLLLKYGTF